MASNKGTNRDQTQDRQKSRTSTNQGPGCTRVGHARPDPSWTRTRNRGSQEQHRCSRPGQNRSGQDQHRDSQGQFTGGGQTSSGSKSRPRARGTSQGSKQGSNR